MKMIIGGMPRPSAVETARDGGEYQSIEIDVHDQAIFTSHRVELIGHRPCGWSHPTWPEEAAGRFQAHLQTCELRDGDSEEMMRGIS